MPDESREQPEYESLVRELGVVREKGLTRLRDLDLPALVLAAELSGELVMAGGKRPIAIEQLLKKAGQNLGDGEFGEMARTLFGLAPGMRGKNPTDLRRMAADIRGIAVESFRKDPEQQVKKALAQEIERLTIGEKAPIKSAMSSQLEIVQQSAAELDRIEPGPQSGPQSGPPQLRVGEKIGDGERYTILDPANPNDVPEAPTDRIAAPLGSGGNGYVYLASFERWQKRAIKFLTANKLADVTGRRIEDFRANFTRERAFLAALSHGHIGRFYHADTYNDQDENKWLYTVIEYVDGDDLLTELASSHVSADQAYDLIEQVIRAIVYMHGRGVLHADIKSENIKCRRIADAPEAVILDLGTAHYLARGDGADRPPFGEKASARIRFVSTWEICHPVHRIYLETGRVVTDKLLKDELFPDHDLHCLGVLLEKIIGDSTIANKLSKVIADNGLESLRAMIDSLKKSPRTKERTGQPEEKAVKRYVDIRDVHLDWKKLRQDYLAPAGVPELSLASEFKYSIMTSSGRLVVTKRLSNVINHKLFQRLRRVPQLEMKLMSFPGATHTRYAHSMEVLRNARYYIAHLLNDPHFRMLTERADIQGTLLLALLHDVGHYQLSHMFEDFAHSQRVSRRAEPWKQMSFEIPSDDDLFRCVIDPSQNHGLTGEYGRAVRDACAHSARRLGLSEDERPTLAQLIRDQFDDDTYSAMMAIHDAIHRPGPDTRRIHLVLGAILSSEIDADKVSYLGEDSARTGVKFGAAIDFEGLMGSLRMPLESDVAGDHPVIGITRKGVAGAQSIAVGRNLMFGRVYLRHTDRAVTSMVKRVIMDLLASGRLTMPKFIEDTLFLEYEAALGYMSDMYSLMPNIAHGKDVNPIAGLLEGERAIYKTAFSTSRIDEMAAAAIGNRVANMGFNEFQSLQEELLELVRDKSSRQDIKPGEVLLDVPVKDRSKASGHKGGKVLVYRDQLDKSPGKPLREYTPFLKGINEQHAHENRVTRVFVSPKIAEADGYDLVLHAVREKMIKLSES